MQETCNVHDATYYLVSPEYINTWVVYEIWETCRNPNTKEYFNFQIDDVSMSMDFVIGRSMAEELPLFLDMIIGKCLNQILILMST